VRRQPCRAAVVIAMLGAVALQARQPEGDRSRYERPVVTAGPGPQRLAIDVPLLIGAAPFAPASTDDQPRMAARARALADLRLVQEDGAPVPYLLVYPPSRAPDWIRARLLAVARTEKTSGFEADLESAAHVDSIRVSGLAAPFHKRLVLEGSGDRRRWTLLAGEGTLFDLPDEGLHGTELPFPEGMFRYLRVTWDDTNSGRVPLPPVVDARLVPPGIAPRVLTSALEYERRPSEPGRSRYRVRLPAPGLPIVAIDLAAGGGYVFRDARVIESRLSGMSAEPAELGRARLTRIVRGGLPAGTLRIPIAAPQEAHIDLVIEDGSNAPLDVTGISAVFAEQPWIYFEAPAGRVTARYGNPAAVRPQYDLEAARGSIKLMSLTEATWGTARPLAVKNASPAPDGSGAEGRFGAAIDASPFAYRRSIPDGPPGLQALVMDGAVLAHSRGPEWRFADVRIVDSSNRQIPYVLEHRDEPLVVDVPLQSADPGVPELPKVPARARSTYKLGMPYSTLPASQIVLQTSARVFQRRVQLGARRAADQRRRDPWLDVLASAMWTHADNTAATPPLTLSMSAQEAIDLWLTVDEGDNAVLPLTSARLLLPSYRLRFYRPGTGALRLVYGRSDLTAPQYDLALLAPEVMGVEAREISALPESGAAAEPVSFVSRRAFWIFLSLSVLVLLALIVRLARRS
jgi:hypothetical protein